MLETFESGHVDGERRFHVAVPVRWRDLDAYGHVNNATLFTLLEEARIAAFWKPQPGTETNRPMGIVDAGSGGDTLTLIAGHAIDYRAPIPHYPEPLDVQIWVSHLGAASAEIAYEVWSPVGHGSRILHTVARSSIVFLDAESQRPRRLNDAERAAWQPFLGEPPKLRVDRMDRAGEHTPGGEAAAK